MIYKKRAGLHSRLFAYSKLDQTLARQAISSAPFI